MAGSELRLGAAFVQQAGVVKSFVRISKAVKNFLDLGVAVPGSSGELIGQSEAEQAQAQLVLGIDRQDIAADRLRLFRLIQRAIELDLRDGLGDAALGNGFQLKIHRASLGQGKR